MSLVTAMAAVIGVAAVTDILMPAGVELVARRIRLPAQVLRAKNKNDAADCEQQQRTEMYPAGRTHGLELNSSLRVIAQ